MLEEQERSVVDARQTGPETPREPETLVLVVHLVLDLFPLHAKGWVGEQVVETARVTIV